MRKLTLDGIELLDAIDRSGSFSGAGVLLNKVTSTVSYAVGKLESDLGVRLFQRHGPRVQITPAGKEMLETGRVLLMAADDLECRIKRIADGWESEIRIASDTLIPSIMLGPLLARFCADAQDTRVKLIGETLTGVWESLLDGRSDAILAVGEGPSGGGFRTEKVAQLQFVFCVAPHHPLATWEGVIPSDEIRKHRTIVTADSARRLPARTVGLLRGQQVVTVPDIRTKYALQVAGLGVGFMPHVFVQSALQRGLLVHKQPQEPKPDDQVSVAWRTDESGPALQWWLDALSEAGVVQDFLNRSSQAWVADY